MTIQWFDSCKDTVNFTASRQLYRKIKHQVRDEIQFGEVVDPNFLGPEIENRRHDGETDVGRNNSFPFVRLEKRRRWSEVL